MCSAGGAGLVPALFTLPFWVVGARLARDFWREAFLREELLLDKEVDEYSLTLQRVDAKEDKQPSGSKQRWVVKMVPLGSGTGCASHGAHAHAYDCSWDSTC